MKVLLLLSVLVICQSVSSLHARRAPEGSHPGQVFNLQALTPSDFQFKGDRFVMKIYGQTHVIPVKESVQHFEVEVHEANGMVKTHVEEFFQYVGSNGYHASFLPLSGHKRSATSFQGNFFIGKQRFYVDEIRESHREQMEEVDEAAHMVVHTGDLGSGFRMAPQLGSQLSQPLAIPAGCATKRSLNSSAVVDPSFYTFCKDWFKVETGYVQCVKLLFSTANTVYDRNINIKMGLYKTVVFKTEATSPIKAQADIGAHGASFVDYVVQRKEKTTQWNLFTGTFHGGQVGVAGVGTLCRSPQTTLSQWWAPLGTANIWEHELGHTFGAQHTPDNTIMCCCCAIPSPIDDFADSSKESICNTIKAQGSCLKVRKA